MLQLAPTHSPKSPFEPAPAASNPPSVEALLRRISDEFASLSPQLKSIARYVERHHECLPLERIQDVAARCEVQPSAVVRFAKRFGFHGFNELKRVMRDRHGSAWTTSRIVQDRLNRSLLHSSHPAGPHSQSADIASAFLQGAVNGLNDLQRDLHLSSLEDAVLVLQRARSLWIVGAQRSFPVASYLAYAFQHGAMPVQFVSLMGGMQASQIRAVRPGDAVLAVSFAPYAQETLDVVQLARTRGATIVALTDSRMGALAAEADVTLQVDEPSLFGFRGLTNSLATAQALFLAYAYRQEANPAEDGQPLRAPDSDVG